MAKDDYHGEGGGVAKSDPLYALRHSAAHIMAHAVQARVRPTRVMEAAGNATRNALALKGRRGEAEEMVDRILSLW